MHTVKNKGAKKVPLGTLWCQRVPKWCHAAPLHGKDGDRVPNRCQLAPSGHNRCIIVVNIVFNHGRAFYYTVLTELNKIRSILAK